MNFTEPTNIAIAGRNGTTYKQLNAEERQKFVDEWSANQQKRLEKEPEKLKFDSLADPKIVSYFCAAAIAHPDIDKRSQYALKLQEYINKIERVSDFDTLKWKL